MKTRSLFFLFWLFGDHWIYDERCYVLYHFIIVWQLLESVEFVSKIHTSYPTVCVNLEKKVEVKWVSVNMEERCRPPSQLTFIFTVSTYLVPNNALVAFAKLTLMCSHKFESVNWTQPEYIIAFVFFVKEVRIICRWTFLSSVTWKLSKTKNIDDAINC